MINFIDNISLGILILLGLFFIYKVIRSLQLVPNQFAYIVERLGNYKKTLGPGFHALIPFF